MASRRPHVRGQQAAQALRLREQIGFDRVDIWQLLDQLQIPVVLREFGNEAGDGLYLWERQMPLILVNASKRASRQRFTAAHELGHHEMHRFDHERLVIEDQDIFASGGSDEAEANAFAAYLLAPDEAILKVLGDRVGERVTPDVVVELMGVFGLSYDATTWRLVNMDVVNRSQRDALVENPRVEERLRRAGLDEAQIFPAPAPLPRAHIDAALRLYEDHVFTAERLGELLDRTPQEAIDYASSRGFVPEGELPIDEDAVDDLLKDA